MLYLAKNPTYSQKKIKYNLQVENIEINFYLLFFSGVLKLFVHF